MKHLYFLSFCILLLSCQKEDIEVISFSYDSVPETHELKGIPILLNLKKTIIGPYDRTISYTTIKNKTYENVVFENGSQVESYSQSFCTKNFVYLLYKAVNGEHPSETYQKVEVFKFDWNGNILCNYKLDMYAYTISVDTEDRNLYASCVDDKTGETIIMKYELR